MTFKELVRAGIIPNGTELIWKRRVQGDVHTAKVSNDSIQTSDGKLHRTPSGAARHLNNGKPIDVLISLYQSHHPKKFKLSQKLSDILGFKYETRTKVVAALW